VRLPLPTTSPVASRRTALAGTLAGLVALAACDDDTSSSSEPVIGASTGATVATGPTDDPDAALVEQVTNQVLSALAAASSIRRSRQDLRRPLTRLVRMHQAHLLALGLKGDRAALHSIEVGADELVALRRAESTLQRQLTDASVAAESGALAEVLASMAAAVAQHLAVLA
jgi:hypothetical protein